MNRQLRTGTVAVVAIFLCLCLLFATQTLAQPALTGIGDAKTPTYTTFDVPAAGKGANQGTSPISVNAAGTIAGYYLKGNVSHGLVVAQFEIFF
jgi:hypothetical protein